jgi:hypothetical protein
MSLKYCYMCNLPYEKSERWSPDGHLNIKRVHCSKQCFRMYKVAYESDNAFRIEHSIRKARESLSTAPETAHNELRQWIKTLEARLKTIKKTRRINRRCRALDSSKRSSGDDRS